MTTRIFLLQSPRELLAAVAQKYFSVASAQRMVALLGSMLNLGSFGAGWKGLAQVAEELGFGVRAVLAPGLQQNGLPL